MPARPLVAVSLNAEYTEERDGLRVSLTINGVEQAHEVEPRLLLAQYIREVAGLTGAHIGCATAQCGACTVIMDGRAVKSCSILAVQANGANVITVEGLAPSAAAGVQAVDSDGTPALHPLQEAFWEHHGLQCGYCTPGMIMAAYGLLLRNRRPTENEIRLGIKGNLCRCTGYETIVTAIDAAATELRATELRRTTAPVASVSVEDGLSRVS